MKPFYFIIQITERLSEISKLINGILSDIIKTILVDKLNRSYTGEQKLSSSSQENRGELLRELAGKLRKFTGLGASFFRTAAGRIGMTVTE